jgi:hypothetical protein
VQEQVGVAGQPLLVGAAVTMLPELLLKPLKLLRL